MLRFFRRAMRRREIYLHEDDYCQQQLLPLGAKAYADLELKRIDDFSAAHRAPEGLGWTDAYMRGDAPLELRTLGMSRRQVGDAVSPFLPPFDHVYTGYSSHRKRCSQTAAWGRSPTCALLVDWDEADVITHCWTMFFDHDEASINAATQAVAALSAVHALVYVDWAWDYTCEASRADAFSELLRAKLKTIARTIEPTKKD